MKTDAYLNSGTYGMYGVLLYSYNVQGFTPETDYKFYSRLVQYYLIILDKATQTETKKPTFKNASRKQKNLCRIC